MARRLQRPRRRTKAVARVTVTKFPYYDDFYVEKVTRPMGFIPVNAEGESGGDHRGLAKNELKPS